jgi:hypothetical protein
VSSTWDAVGWVRPVPSVAAVTRLVEDKYAVLVTQAVLARSFTNDVYQVHAGEHANALKVYGVGRWAPDEVRWEQQLVRHLANRGCRSRPPWRYPTATRSVSWTLPKVGAPSRWPNGYLWPERWRWNWDVDAPAAPFPGKLRRSASGPLARTTFRGTAPSRRRPLPPKFRAQRLWCLPSERVAREHRRHGERNRDDSEVSDRDHAWPATCEASFHGVAAGNGGEPHQPGAKGRCDLRPVALGCNRGEAEKRKDHHHRDEQQ